MTNLDSVLKSRDITLSTKVHLVKAIVFPVMYGFESWTIMKAKGQRIDAFELWCWRLLRVPWTARRSNQSILKGIRSEYSLEGLMLKLKLQYLGHLMRRTNALEKTHAGKDWILRRMGMTEGEMVGWHHRLDGHEFEQAPGGSKRQGRLVGCHAESQTWLSDWATTLLKFKTGSFLLNKFPSTVTPQNPLPGIGSGTP